MTGSKFNNERNASHSERARYGGRASLFSKRARERKRVLVLQLFCVAFFY